MFSPSVADIADINDVPSMRRDVAQAAVPSASVREAVVNAPWHNGPPGDDGEFDDKPLDPNDGWDDDTCQTCGGDGDVDDDGVWETCPSCHGTGVE
jgi:hypothetical protein